MASIELGGTLKALKGERAKVHSELVKLNLNYARLSLDPRWKSEFRPHQFFLSSVVQHCLICFFL